MKHIALLIFLLLTTKLFSQNIEDNQKKIRVSGRAQIEIEPTSYAIDIQIREIPTNSTNYNMPPTIAISIDSIEFLLKQYLDKAGYDSKKLTSIFMNSNGTSYGNSQYLNLIYMTFEYRLKNLSDVNTFIRKIRFDGIVGMRARKMFDVNKTEIEAQLFKEALKDAKTKAEKLLATTNKLLGDILSIDMSSYNPIFNDDYQNSWYGNSTSMEFVRTKTIATSITVNFEIK